MKNYKFSEKDYNVNKFNNLLLENKLWINGNPNLFLVDPSGYLINELLDMDDETFKLLKKVNNHVITYDSQGETCDSYILNSTTMLYTLQKSYVEFIANHETVNNMLNNLPDNLRICVKSDGNICTNIEGKINLTKEYT